MIDEVWNLTEGLGSAWREWPGAVTRSAEDQAASAFRLAMAIGRCLLFDFTPRDTSQAVELPSVESAVLLMPKAHQATIDLRNRVPELDKSVINADSTFERHDCVINFLSRRIDIQAAWVAAARRAGITELPGPDFESRIGSVADVPEVYLAELVGWSWAIEALDEAIAGIQETIATIATTYWWSNVAAEIAPAAWAPLPWWLTRRIQSVYQQHEELVRALWQSGEAHTISFGPPAFLMHWEPFLSKAVGNVLSMGEASDEEKEPLVSPAHKPHDFDRSDARPAELSMAADTGASGASFEPFVRFDDVSPSGLATIELRVERDWLDKSPLLWPNLLFVKLVVVVRRRGPFRELRSPSEWRVRLGTLIDNIRLSEYFPRAEELIGVLEFQVEKIHSMLRLKAFGDVSMRRMG
jgi:hypothetical protein